MCHSGNSPFRTHGLPIRTPEKIAVLFLARLRVYRCGLDRNEGRLRAFEI